MNSAGETSKMHNTTLLNLVVIRSAHIDRAVSFYEAIGLEFTKHAHGNGPEHYASEHGGFVFEIYPQKNDESTENVRIGFLVNGLVPILDKLRRMNATISQAPKETPWGLRAVAIDFDGHCVELIDNAA